GGSASTNCSHDSISKRLGVKKFGGEFVRKGSIIIRQRGTTYKGGKGVFFGRDYTVHAEYDGTVKYYKRFRGRVNRTFVESDADQGNLEYMTINTKKSFPCHGINPIETLYFASEFVKIHCQGLINRGYIISEVENGEVWKLEKKDP
ncbi:5354_t:CDS:2, partial [Ambispora gerdemannii]